MKSLSLCQKIITSLTIVILTTSLFPAIRTSSSQLFTVDDPLLIDVDISLYRTPDDQKVREKYEHIIEYFADGVYEASNAAHKISKVSIYTGARYSDKADILWVEKCHPNANPNGRGSKGLHVNMCDEFNSENFLANDYSQRGGGYTLAHEWGHYFYGLYDEYKCTKKDCSKDDKKLTFPHSTDKPVPDSIMNHQWNARVTDGSGAYQYDWLNFSVAKNDTKETAQNRVYEASGWVTLARTRSKDPRGLKRLLIKKRLYYSDLAAVAPGENESATINLPGDARSDLEIVWVSSELTYQIVIDHSGSMEDEKKMKKAKIAAKMLVDLAEIEETTIGVIEFDDSPSVIQSLTKIQDKSTKKTIKSSINKIEADGGTAIGDAAKKALDDLLAAKTKDINQVVFLLTDGQNREGIDPVSVIPEYKSANVRLFTFGFGSNVNSSVLREMATETGGKYYASPTKLKELTQAFQDASEWTSPKTGVASGGGKVSQGVPSSFPVDIDSSLNTLNFVVIYPGAESDISLELSNPVGDILPPDDCSSTDDEVLCVFDIEDAFEGEWDLQATSLSGEVPITYRVSGSTDETITYVASVNNLTGEVVRYPEPLEILALVGKEWPITGVAVQASLQKPDDDITEIVLKDDGVAPDAVGSDGLYSAILNYDQDGIFNITIQFDNKAGTAQMTDVSFAPSIGPNGETGPTETYIPIAENFERITRMQVEVTGVRSDDHGNTPSEATKLVADNTDQVGKIDYQKDLDVFRIDSIEDSELIIRISNLALGMEPQLRVIASDMVTILASADLQTDANPTYGYLMLPINVGAGDTIYAEVSDVLENASGGIYDISVGTRITGEGNPIPPAPGPGVGSTNGNGMGIAFVLLALVMGGVFIYVVGQRRSRGRKLKATILSAHLFVSGPGVSGQYPITKDNCLIGRGSKCDLRLLDRAVSRQHARLRYAQGAWFIQDQGSAGGTYVNGQRVQATRLNSGDRITIGSTILVFQER